MRLAHGIKRLDTTVEDIVASKRRVYYHSHIIHRKVELVSHACYIRSQGFTPEELVSQLQ